MKEMTYVINDPLGIHARPAGLLVKKAKEFACEITLAKGGKTIDAKKLFAVMGLSVKKDDTITLIFTGEDEAAAAEAFDIFMKENL